MTMSNSTVYYGVVQLHESGFVFLKLFLKLSYLGPIGFNISLRSIRSKSRGSRGKAMQFIPIMSPIWIYCEGLGESRTGTTQ